MKELQVRKIWNNLSDDYLHSLCTSMNWRMRAVLKSEGAATKYWSSNLLPL